MHNFGVRQYVCNRRGLWRGMPLKRRNPCCWTGSVVKRQRFGPGRKAPRLDGRSVQERNGESGVGKAAVQDIVEPTGPHKTRELKTVLLILTTVYCANE